MQSEKNRLFIGIRVNPAPELLALSKHLQILLQDYYIKWVEPGNFHITLKFLGDIDLSTEKLIGSMLQEVGKLSDCFRLHFDKPGYFVSKSRPNVIWHGFTTSEAFSRLRQRIQLGLTDLGINSADNNSIVHLTLGRLKKDMDSQVLNKSLSGLEKLNGSINIQSLQLVQSKLRPEGPVYTTRKEILLGK